MFFLIHLNNMHLKKSGRLRRRNWRHSSSRSQSLVFIFFCFLINLHAHCRLTGYIHFSFIVSLYSYVCLLTALDLSFSLHASSSTPCQLFFFHYPLAITGVICFAACFFCDERRFPYLFLFSPIYFLFLGFRFLMGIGRVCLEEGWTGLAM